MRTLTLLKLFGFFLLFYALTLALWLNFKPPYQSIVNTLAFKGAGWLYDIKLNQTKMLPDGTTVMEATNRFASIGLDGKDNSVIFDVILDIGAVTFNVPMTLALLLAIVTVLGTGNKTRFEVIFNGMTLLVGLHLLTMFVISLSLILGAAEQSPRLSFYLQHSWMPRDFLVNLGTLLSTYASRFEPFLIALFVWWQLSVHHKPETSAVETEHTKKTLPDF